MPDTTTPIPTAILLVEAPVIRFGQLPPEALFLQINAGERKRLSSLIWKKGPLPVPMSEGNCYSAEPDQNEYHFTKTVPDDELVFVVT